MKSKSKLIHFHSRKCIWKSRLKNVGHLVSASMCYDSRIIAEPWFQHTIVWWCLDLDKFSALMPLCEWNPPVTGGFSSYSRTIASIANVFCWLYPTLNKVYLILSYLKGPYEGNHQWLVDSVHKGPVMPSFDVSWTSCRTIKLPDVHWRYYNALLTSL